jgi:hypothetical protein
LIEHLLGGVDPMVIVPDPRLVGAHHPSADTHSVDLAVEALSAFGDIDRATAERLLSSWRFNPELSRRERAAVLDRLDGGRRS